MKNHYYKQHEVKDPQADIQTTAVWPGGPWTLGVSHHGAMETVGHHGEPSLDIAFFLVLIIFTEMLNLLL